jgi:hypothetical protein
MKISMVLMVLFLGSGCAAVQPWERGIHAKRCMQINPDPLATSIEQHVFEYREAAAGGYEALGGSGCGCN